MKTKLISLVLFLAACAYDRPVPVQFAPKHEPVKRCYPIVTKESHPPKTKPKQRGSERNRNRRRVA